MKWFNAVKRVVEKTDTISGKIFDFTVQGLVIVSLISFSLETLPDLSESHKSILSIIEIITVLLFSVEYLLRIVVARKKLSFVFSFFGLVDLIAILPFYLSLGIDLRSIRIVRLLRIFRMLKLARFGSAIKRFRMAFSIVKEELILFSSVTAMLLYVSAVGIYYFENEVQPQMYSSVFDGLWWAVVSLTSVGYGDIYPITVGGKLFACLVILIGLGIVAVPTGLFASALSQVRKLESDEADLNQKSKTED